MNKRIITFGCIFTLLISIQWLLPINAAIRKTDIQNKYNRILKTWNKNPKYTKKNSEYMGGYQCAAFSRFAFMKLWGHTDEIDNEDNIVRINTELRSVGQVSKYIRKAAPGDALRIVKMHGNKQTLHTHIIQLLDITKSGIVAYDSNFENNKNNIARFMIYPSVETWISSCTGIKNPQKKSWRICVKIIHAKENPLTRKNLSINKVMINKTKLKIRVGEAAKLKVMNTKEKIKWKVFNEKIAKVTKKGVVKGKHEGKAWILARVGKKVLRCKIVVLG